MEDDGKNQFRSDFYNDIWLAVANIGLFNTNPVRQSPDMG